MASYPCNTMISEAIKTILIDPIFPMQLPKIWEMKVCLIETKTQSLLSCKEEPVLTEH